MVHTTRSRGFPFTRRPSVWCVYWFCESGFAVLCVPAARWSSAFTSDPIVARLPDRARGPSLRTECTKRAVVTRVGCGVLRWPKERSPVCMCVQDQVLGVGTLLIGLFSHYPASLYIYKR
jgi:hypothetical protein